jgi:hypothetical protein
MLRIRLIIALVLAAIATVVAMLMLNHGRENPVQPPAAPEIKFHAGVFLAPGAIAELPTTIRLKVWLSSDLLPVTSAEIDTDGDQGPLKPTSLDVSLWEAAGDEGTMSTLFFDIPWASPDSAQPTLTVHCAKGNYETQCNVNPNSLQPWPESK